MLPCESWIDDIRCGVMSTPPLAMPAATMAFCSAVSWTNVLPDGRVGLVAPARSWPDSGVHDAEAMTFRAGRSAGTELIAEELGLLAQRRHALLHAELAVAGVAREAAASAVMVPPQGPLWSHSGLFESENVWHCWTG